MCRCMAPNHDMQHRIARRITHKHDRATDVPRNQWAVVRPGCCVMRLSALALHTSTSHKPPDLTYNKPLLNAQMRQHAGASRAILAYCFGWRLPRSAANMFSQALLAILSLAGATMGDITPKQLGASWRLTPQTAGATCACACTQATSANRRLVTRIGNRLGLVTTMLALTTMTKTGLHTTPIARVSDVPIGQFSKRRRSSSNAAMKATGG